MPKQNTPPTLLQKPAAVPAVQEVPMQQAPMGCGLQGLPGLQEIPAPQTTFAPAHPEAEVWVQLPVSKLQHAPEEATQLLGEQEVPAPENVLEPVQPEAIVREQVPTLEQHAPLREVQGFAVQVVFTPAKVPGLVQPERMVMVQLPMLEQHAPWSAVQGVGKQVVPAPRKVLLPPQPLPPELDATKQPPTGLQQAPVTLEQGAVGAQVVPAPLKRPLQPSATVDVQVPAIAQHAPRSEAQGSTVQVVPVP